MGLDLAEQPASESESEIEITAKFPLNSPMGCARDSLRIGNRKSPRRIQLNSPTGRARDSLRIGNQNRRAEFN